jgi:hypothetical protein
LLPIFDIDSDVLRQSAYVLLTLKSLLANILLGEISLLRLYFNDFSESLPLFFYNACCIVFEEKATSGIYFSGNKPN